MKIWAWSNQYSCRDENVVKRRGENIANVPREFYEKEIRGLKRKRTDVLCPVGESMFLHRTCGEVGPLESLHTTLEER